MKEGTKLGPLATSGARKNLHRQVLDAVKAGARILTGGEIPDGPGSFYPATVLVGLPPEAPIAQEEFFGPVAMFSPSRLRKRRFVWLTSLTSVSALRSGAVTSSGPVALPARSSLGWYLSMTSPAPIPAHRSEASRLQGMGANLALPAHGTLPTQN